MTEKRLNLWIVPLVFAVFATGGLFFWQGRFGFSFWDEGHLWYGAQRVLAGEVPIRDFRSYDPGRYYWSAAWMALLKNDGILALRLSVLLFLTPGLWAGLRLIPRFKTWGSFLYLVLSVLVLSAWMFPRQKLFDISICLILIASLAALLSKPSLLRFFLYGFVTGLVAFFGRNHGLYSIVGGLLAAVYLAVHSGIRRGWLQRIACWGGGGVAGSVFFLVLSVWIPGFFEAFRASLLFSGKTVLPIPVPWPWAVDFQSIPPDMAVSHVLMGVCFIALIVAGVLGLVWLFLFRREKKVAPALAASILMIFPYTHHAFSRADIAHLAQGIFPLLLCLLVGLTFLPNRGKWAGIFCLFAVSLTVMRPVLPGWEGRSNPAWVEKDIGGDVLRVSPSDADDVKMVESLVQTYSPGGRSFVAVPYWPGAYALVRQKAPMYDVFPLFERTEQFQRKEISRIQKSDPGFVVVMDVPLDQLEARRFKNTNPLIEEYIRTHFERLDGFASIYQVYRAR